MGHFLCSKYYILLDLYARSVAGIYFTYFSQNLPTILKLYQWMEKKYFGFFKPDTIQKHLRACKKSNSFKIQFLSSLSGINLHRLMYMWTVYTYNVSTNQIERPFRLTRYCNLRAGCTSSENEYNWRVRYCRSVNFRMLKFSRVSDFGIFSRSLEFANFLFSLVALS